MKILTPFLLVGTPLVLVGSVEAAPKAPGQSVSYVGDLPSAVRRRVPRGRKSHFFGTFKLASNGPKYWLHLYDLKAWGLSIERHAYGVDVFQQGSGVGKRTSYRLINHFPLNFSGWAWQPDKFAVQILWLDPRQHRKPIIKFDCFTRGDYGPGGDNVLAVFPQGLKAQPIVQTLPFGGWKASDTSGQDNWYDTTDARGLLQIRTQVYLSTSEVPTPPPSILKWNGNGFS